MRSVCLLGGVQVTVERKGGGCDIDKYDYGIF